MHPGKWGIAEAVWDKTNTADYYTKSKGGNESSEWKGISTAKFESCSEKTGNCFGC